MARRCWYSLAALLVAAQGVGAADEEGFVSLFDGRSTHGWTTVGGKPENWIVKDGLLVTRGKGGGWLSTEKTYDDFVLRLEYRIGPGGNSGVFFRAPHRGDPAYTGMEIQILDDDDARYKDLKPAQYTGSIYGIAAARRGHANPPGRWNALEIRAEGPRITVKLNGATIVEANLEEHADAAREHPGILRQGGHIGLQSHSHEVHFRNLAIKELKPAAS